MIGRIQRLVVRYSHLNWAVADQGMVSACNFTTTIILARFLGLEEFGRYTLAWTAVLILKSFQGVVIEAPMISIGPKQEADSLISYYGAVVVQQGAFCVVSFFFLWAAADAAAMLFPEWNIAGLALPLASAAVAFQMQDFLRHYFFARNRIVSAFALDALRYPGQVAVLFWLFHTVPMDSGRVLWVISAFALLAALVFGAPLIRQLSWDRNTFFAVARRHWVFSRWLIASAVMTQIRSQIFIIGTGALVGASAVGAMKAAQTLMGVTNVVIMALNNVVPVRAARRFNIAGAEALKQFVIRVAFFGEFFVIAVVIAAFLAPEFWLWLAYGDEYAGYGILLQWIAVSELFYFPNMSVTAGLRAMENTRLIFYTSAISATTAVIIIYPLLSQAGIIGAVAGILVVNVVTLCGNGVGFFWSLSRLTRNSTPD